MLSLSSIVYAEFRFVQLRKYSPNSRCRPPSCLLAVFTMFLAIISASSSCSSYSWNEWSVCHFSFYNENNLISSPGRLGWRWINLKKAAFLTSFPRQTQNSSKFAHQQLVMVKYACAFSQSELGKYFEWIIIIINKRFYSLTEIFRQPTKIEKINRLPTKLLNFNRQVDPPIQTLLLQVAFYLYIY